MMIHLVVLLARAERIDKDLSAFPAPAWEPVNGRFPDLDK